MIRLNIGAGNDIRPKAEWWVNCDIRQLPGIDVVADARKLAFEDNSADHMLAQDIIEHIPPSDVDATLQEWYRVLKPGGTIEIRTPDWLKLARGVITRRLQPREFFFLLFGDQSPEAGGPEWGGHKNGMTQDEWKVKLQEIGFTNITVRGDEHEFNQLITAAKGEEAERGDQDQTHEDQQKEAGVLT